MCVIVDYVNFYQILVHVTVIFRNLIFVCITIKDKLIKHLYNSHFPKLPIAHGEVSVMLKYHNGDKVGIIITRYELLFLWILPMCKLHRITHKRNIKTFGLYSVCK